MRKTLFILLALAALVSCVKEQPVESAFHTLPYSAWVSEAPDTRATLSEEGGLHYVFQADDRLYVSGTGAAAGKLYGYLHLIAGNGTQRAHFEGDLYCANDFYVNASTPISLTLVGASDRIHGASNARLLDTPVYASGAFAPTFAQAVEQFGDFTAESTFGAKEFTLAQQSSFVLLNISVDPGKVGDGDPVPVVIYNNGSEIWSGSVPAVSPSVNESTVSFVVAFPGGTVLSGANVTVTEDGADKSFPMKDATLVSNYYYSVFNDTVDMDYFTVESTVANTQVTFNYAEAGDGVQYSRNRYTWTDYLTTDGAILLPNVGDKVYFRAKRTSYDRTNDKTVVSVDAASKKCYVYGDIMTLLCDPAQSGYVPATSVGEHAFRGAFQGATWLMSHSLKKLKLPSTDLSTGCYYRMFYGCTSLVTAPDLPATQLAVNCYYQMFYGCKALSSRIYLPATQMVEGAYFATFYDCLGVTDVTCLLEGEPTYAERVANFDKWFKNIVTSGTFRCPASMVDFWNTMKTNKANTFAGLPNTWTVTSVE